MSVNALSQSKTYNDSKNGAPMATELRALIDGLNEDLAGAREKRVNNILWQH